MAIGFLEQSNICITFIGEESHRIHEERFKTVFTTVGWVPLITDIWLEANNGHFSEDRTNRANELVKTGELTDEICTEELITQSTEIGQALEDYQADFSVRLADNISIYPFVLNDCRLQMEQLEIDILQERIRIALNLIFSDEGLEAIASSLFDDDNYSEGMWMSFNLDEEPDACQTSLEDGIMRIEQIAAEITAP